MLTPRAPFVIATGILLLAVVVFVVAFTNRGGSKKSSGNTTTKAQPTAAATAPATPGGAGGAAGDPTQALAGFVQQTMSKPFLPDCTKTDPAKDAGSICATFKADRTTQKAYQLAPVGAPPIDWVILEGASGTWSVASTLTLTPDNSGVPGIPWPLRTGVDIVVAGSNPCVNVREGPGLNQKAVDCIADGTHIQLTAGPTAADNLQWWQVMGRTGWVVSDYLRYPDAAQ